MKENILFVDENLLQASQSEELIQSMVFQDDIKIPEFVLKQSRFKRLEIGNRNFNFIVKCRLSERPSTVQPLN